MRSRRGRRSRGVVGEAEAGASVLGSIVGAGSLGEAAAMTAVLGNDGTIEGNFIFGVVWNMGTLGHSGELGLAESFVETMGRGSWSAPSGRRSGSGGRSGGRALTVRA